MDVKKIKESIEVLSSDLGEGFVSCDVWVSGSGQAIVSHKGGNVKATALFDQISSSVKNALKVAEFPEIDPYYLFHLDNGLIILVLLQDKYQWGIAIDPEKAPLGLVLNIAIPNVIEKLNA